MDGEIIPAGVQSPGQGGERLPHDVYDASAVMAMTRNRRLRRTRHIKENGNGKVALLRPRLLPDSVIRLAWAQAQELQPHGCTAVALTPGWLRSEMMLENYGVSEANWREATTQAPHFAISESPAFVGRAVAALASDPEVARFADWPRSTSAEASLPGLAAAGFAGTLCPATSGGL